MSTNIIPTKIPPYMIDSYKQYMSYIVAGRVTCNHMDGFLNIHRRILYAASQIARKNNVKSARLDGETIGKYSPHGACYGSIVDLVSCGMLIGKGSFANNMGVEREDPAAERYTEVRLNPITEILFMNRELMPYVDYKETELSTIEDKYYEPLFLPILIPGIYTALAETAEFNSYMALKLSVKYPRFSAVSLLKYAINYLKTGKFDTNLLYYQFHNIIRKCEVDDQSKFEVEFKCPAMIDPDDNNIVHLLSTLPFVDMTTLLKDIPYEDHTSTKTDIIFNKSYFTSKFKSNIKFNVKAYELVDNDYDNVILHDYPIQYAIIKAIENLKTIIFPRFFADKEDKLRKQIAEYELLKIVRDKYINNKIPFEQLSDDERSCASRHSSAIFMTLDDKINNLNNDLQVLLARAKNIDNEILKLYEEALTSTTEYLNKYYKNNDIVIYDVTNN